MSREHVAYLDHVTQCLGFDPESRLISHAETISAAIWRFDGGPTYEVAGPANEANVISLPVLDQFHHTYHGDGRQKWSRLHASYTTNVVSTGEQPRGVFVIDAVRHSAGVLAAVHRRSRRQPNRSGHTGQPRHAGGPDADPDVERIARQLVREMVHPDRCARLMLDALGHELAIRLLRKHSNISRSNALVPKHAVNTRDWRLRRAIDYVEAHLADDVGLREIADGVGLSVTHLTTLFRDGTGEPPHRYLMRRRFERACELLGDPSISISDIAYRCGFANPQHLAMVRRHLAMTPTAYRRQVAS